MGAHQGAQLRPDGVGGIRAAGAVWATRSSESQCGVSCTLSVWATRTVDGDSVMDEPFYKLE